MRTYRQNLLLLAVLFTAVTSLSLIQPAGAASFSFTGSMTTNRENHTATLLTNGLMLVVGGITNADAGGVDLASAELFNPNTGTWTLTGTMANARNSHTATLLPNGKVLVAGGAGTSGVLSSVELFDPTTGNWTLTNSMKSARGVHSATLLTNGLVLVAGGTLDGINPISSVEMFNPATGSWTLTNSMHTARAYHSATLLGNGKVLVVGGASGAQAANTIPGAELFDPATGNWMVTGSPNTPRGFGHTATLLPNGKVLVVAGGNGGTVTNNAELYDPTTGLWTYTGSLTTGARHSHTATLLPDGTVLIAGGDNQNVGLLASAEIYNPATGLWTATNSLNTSREWHTATVLTNGNVLIAGGTGNGDGTPALASAELYNSTIVSLAVTTTSLPNGTNGVAYQQTLAASGGQTPYSWTNSSGVLPLGLTLLTNGLITGTPSTSGIFNFNVKVTDASSETATQAFVVTVFPSVVLQPTNNLVGVIVGSNVTFSVSVSGTGPFNYRWQLNGTYLPNGIITTVAGNGTSGYSGDGNAATNATMNYPYGVAVDIASNLFIVDIFNNCVRKVGSNGIITTVAGGGTNNPGDGGAATNALLNNPLGVAVDAAGNLFIAAGPIRKVDTNGIITTVAGGSYGYSGDGGAATNAALKSPNGVAVDAVGNLFIADSGNYVIRKVNASGIITTVAGNGSYGYSGDGGAATNAALTSPNGVAVDTAGNLFIVDTFNYCIRKVNINGIITTVAGIGSSGSSGDGVAATNAALNYPLGVGLDAVGDVFIADDQDQRIRKVGTNGIITTVAGYRTPGYSGDGGLATLAKINYPHGVAVDAAGNLFIADGGNYVIRQVFNPNILVTASTLTLNNVGFANAGAYDVVVSGPYGSVTSSVVNLAITLPPLFLSTPQFSIGNTNFTFLLSGPSGSNYVLQVSTNLLNWNPVSTSTIPAGGSLNLSNAINGYSRQFYRAYLK
jgi:sugar lactone lactonase YvrE